MSDRFTGQVAVVTGGVSGIGAQITRRLADEGARVLALDINADLVATATETFGENVTGMVADVTSPESFGAAVERAVTDFGTLDVLFNVAGGSKPAPLATMSFEDWDFTVRLNLYSAFLGTQLAAQRFLAEGKAGAIVNIASLNSQVPMHFGAGYTASKAAVAMLTKQAALEFGGAGIRVNAVSPGLVATPLTDGLTQLPGVTEAFNERIPLGRPADPAEIASVALFLASPDASYVSGENILVDGAWATTGYPDLRKFLS